MASKKYNRKHKHSINFTPTEAEQEVTSDYFGTTPQNECNTA